MEERRAGTGGPGPEGESESHRAASGALVPALVLAKDPRLAREVERLVESIHRVREAVDLRADESEGAGSATRGANAACSTLHAVAEFLEELAEENPGDEELSSMAEETARELRGIATRFEDSMRSRERPRRDDPRRTQAAGGEDENGAS